ncbi:MAG: hypothetical protein AB8F94_17450 [Saprospiraceae bacterium]
MNQDLLLKMNDYSDVRIMNTIQQSNNFAPEIVEAAKYIAAEKGLTSPERMHMYDQRAKYLRMAKEQINNGVEPELIKKSLMNYGADEIFALEILGEAARTMTIGGKRVEEKESGGTSIWTILFVIFIFIRIALRMASN